MVNCLRLNEAFNPVDGRTSNHKKSRLEAVPISRPAQISKPVKMFTNGKIDDGSRGSNAAQLRLHLDVFATSKGLNFIAIDAFISKI